MKKILLLLLISISGYSQTLLKLKAIEYAPGAGYCVITNTAGVQTYTLCSSLSGSLTTNYIPKATSSTSLTNSSITDNSSIVTVNNDFYVNTGSAEVSAQGTRAYISADQQTNTNIESNLTENYFLHDIKNSFNAPINSFTGAVNTSTLTANQILLTNTVAPTYSVGTLWYNPTYQCLSVYDDISGTSIEVGQETVVRVRNNTGSTIADGQVVYISGALGQNPTIALAKADAELTSLTIGVATHSIPNNTVGKITISGLINDLNTSAFADGDALFLSSATAGSLTNVAPSSPNYVVPVGIVAHSHITQGKILVRTDLPIASNTVISNSNRVAPTSNAVKVNLDKKIGVIVKDITVSAPLTGTTAITAMKSVLIPAHTFTVGDICQIFNRALRSTATGSSINYLYINTTNSLSGATLIGLQSAASRFYGMERNLFIRSETVSETFDSGTSASGDFPFVSTAATSELNIDWSVNQYIIHAFGAAATGNSTTSNGLIVIKQ